MVSRAGEQLPRLEPGARVDHYVVTRFLARGHAGETYVARDTRLGRRVALKLIAPEHTRDQAAIAGFLGDARATAACSHPGILNLFAVGEHAGAPYLALEYVEGRTLRARMDEEPPGARAALRLGASLAEALAEAHRQGVLHLGLTPENVLLGRDGRLRIVELGMAWLERGWLKEDAPAYLAPELWRQAEPSSAADVWALGVILHELVEGRRPFRADTLAELGALVTSDAPAPWIEPGRAPASVSDIVRRCLHKQHELRPSAGEVMAVLTAAMGPSPVILHPQESPFRGLLPFVEQHAISFFGRDEEIATFLELLREQPLVPIVGASGAGKTSFVRAGIIPHLDEQGGWSAITARPGGAPMHSLALALRGVVPGEAVTADDLLRTPSLLGQLLRAHAGRRGVRVLLFVDQLEELFVRVADVELRERYLRALCLAAPNAGEGVRVILAARDDFVGRLAEVAEMRAALAHVTVLHTPGPTALRQIVTRSAAAAGYRFDDPSLPDEMTRAVHGEPAALPHLQFALQLLWERRDSRERLLLRAVHDEIGGVAGALAARADEVLVGLSAAEAGLARELLLRLVTPERTRRTVGRRELLDGSGAAAEAVLQRLVGARLVSVGAGAGEPELELAHESLIASWNQLARWLDEGREERALVAELAEAAELWDRRGRRADQAWHEPALGDARRALARLEVAPTETVRAFVAAGERQDQRRRAWRRRLVLGAVLLSSLVVIASLGAALVIARANVLVDRRRRDADRRRAEAHLAQARRALDDGAMLEARANVRAALEIMDSVPARNLWSRLRREPLIWAIPHGGLEVPAFDLRGRVTVARGDTLQLVDPGSTLARRTMQASGLEYAIVSSGFSSDSQLLVAGSRRREVGVFHVPTGTFELLGHGDREDPSPAISPDGRTVAVRNDAAGVDLLEVSSGVTRTLSPPIARPGRNNLAFSRDGSLIAAAGAGVLVWSVPAGAVVRELETKRACSGVAFGAGGVLAAACGPAVLVWDLPSGNLIADLRGHLRDLQTVAISPDGARLASAGFDPFVLVWDLGDGKVHRTLRGHGSVVHGLAFSPDGRRLAASSQDGRLRLYDLSVPTDGGAAAGEPSRPSPDGPRGPAPFLGRDGSLLTRQGWIALAGRHGPASRRGRAIEGALEQRARLASESTDGGLVCMVAGDELEVWAADGGEPLLRTPVADVVDVLAVPAGCALRAGGGVRLQPRSGLARVLQPRASVLGEDERGDLIVAGPDGIVRFDGAGEEKERLPGASDLTAAAQRGSRLALGHADGTIEVRRVSGGEIEAPLSIAGSTGSPVVSLAFTPAGALAAGFQDGLVTAHDVDSGELLARAQLGAAAVHLRARADVIHAADMLGDHATLDLGPWGAAYCVLLEEVWRSVPVIWADGGPRAAAPPEGHPCRR